MEKILLNLGLNKISEYKSEKEFWKYKKQNIVFAKFTMPAHLTFMEIEGNSDKEIKETVKLLGDNVKEVGEEIAEEYMKLVKAINRHRRLIGVIIDSAAEEYKQSVRNLILSQKRLIEAMKKRAEEIEKLLEKRKKKK